MSYGRLLETPPDWEEHEKPAMPGSPASPIHPPLVRVAYVLIGILIGATGGFGNALVTANLPQIQGDLGLTPVQGAWLTSAYFMTNLSGNLILFKARQQIGIRIFAESALLAYLTIISLHLVIDRFETALLVRAAAGLVAVPLNTLGILYILQAIPRAKMGPGLCIGLGFTQMWTPIAWILSPFLLDLGNWHMLYLFELGLAMMALATAVLLKLPVGMRIKVLEWQDFATFLLVATAFALIAAVMAQGLLQWWTERRWIAFALIAALALLLIAFRIEHYRTYQLIQTRWLGTGEFLRFVLGAFMMRMLMAEQTYAATGLLKMLGMGPDQLQLFYVIVLAGVVVGVAISVLLFGPQTLIAQLLASMVLVMVASLLDRSAPNLIRPHDLMVSQFLMSMATGMFLGPLLFTGAMMALSKGAEYMVTFIVIYTVTQGLGGLAGPALYGTFQQMREHEYSAQITMHLNPADPVVAGRLALQGQALARQLTAPMLQQAQGVRQLAQSATREANVRAYNDVFTLNAVIAFFFLIWSLYRAFVSLRAARATLQSAGAPADAAI
jgi:MFS family permease